MTDMTKMTEKQALINVLSECDGPVSLALIKEFYQRSPYFVSKTSTWKSSVNRVLSTNKDVFYVVKNGKSASYGLIKQINDIKDLIVSIPDDNKLSNNIDIVIDAYKKQFSYKNDNTIKFSAIIVQFPDEIDYILKCLSNHLPSNIKEIAKDNNFMYKLIRFELDKNSKDLVNS